MLSRPDALQTQRLQSESYCLCSVSWVSICSGTGSDSLTSVSLYLFPHLKTGREIHGFRMCTWLELPSPHRSTFILHLDMFSLMCSQWLVLK